MSDALTMMEHQWLEECERTARFEVENARLQAEIERLRADTERYLKMLDYWLRSVSPGIKADTYAVLVEDTAAAVDAARGKA